MHKSHKSVIFHVVMGRNPWRDLDEIWSHLFIWSTSSILLSLITVALNDLNLVRSKFTIFTMLNLTAHTTGLALTRCL
jgi:hypothetical protein